MLLVVVVPTIWATSPRDAQANFAGNDDFSAPSASWGADSSGGAGGFVLQDGKLNFVTDGLVTNNDTSQRQWIANFGSYTADWSLRMDVAIADFPMTDGEYATTQITVESENDPSQEFVRVSLRRDDATSRYFYADAYSNDVFLDAVFVPTSATLAAIGLSYDSAAHVITAGYDGDGPDNGYLFAPMLAIAIDSGASDWNMDPTDVFSTWLVGQTANLAVTVGQLTVDNFAASGDQLLFAPEPAAAWLGGAAVVIVFGLSRDRRCQRRSCSRNQNPSILKSAREKDADHEFEAFTTRPF